MRLPSRAGIARRAGGALTAIDDRLPHGRRVVDYCGFELVHSRRTSIVDRLREQGAYEPAVIRAIVEALEPKQAPTLVDVGAHVGLVSLAVLAAVPNSRVFAFEPAPHQHALLAETIRRNRLEERVSLSPLALADRPGRAPFVVHPTRLSPGDGLRDTGRAGRGREVTVETDTLDRWWTRAGRPAVHALKLDTEGAELLVLRGGAALLAEARPVVFLEIHPLNLRAYDHDADDVLRHLESAGYEVEELARTDYVARPR